MSSTTVQTVTTILESLPDSLQQQVAHHLSEYIEELRAELQWDASFARTAEKLEQSAKRANVEIDASLSQPMDLSKL